MAFVHPTKYRFYMQRYPDADSASYPVVDIEEAYDCRYVELKDLLFNGDVKNTYSESFAESSGDKVWLPKQKDLSFKSKECTLKLRFRDGDVEGRARRFYTDFRGVKFEYHDTFRNRYASFILTKEPRIEFQKLTGDTSYMIVSYTLTNFLGFPYDETRI